MIMKMQEEIDNFALTHHKDIAGETDYTDTAAFEGIIAGAKWADEHPSVDTVKKIICYALRFTNIMLVDDLEKGIEWESLIKKAMEE
jgi:hypothetical protein